MSFLPLTESENTVLARIKTGDKNALAEIYRTYRNSFLQFARRYSSDEELICDVYQDAIIALYEKILRQDFQLKSSSLKTYLFGIGKYMLFSKSKMNVVTEPLQDAADEVGYEDTLADFFQEPDRNVVELEAAFKQLGEKCRKVLVLFYYEGKKINEIKEILGYSQSDVVKSQKSRCLKSLKALIGAKALNEL